MKLLVRAIHLSLQLIGPILGAFPDQQFGQLQQVAPRHPIMLWFSKLRRDGNEMNHMLRKQGQRSVLIVASC
ncbi:hypothetical protein Pyn_01586 [Prunus yedoensis var. nudiflora]|uniref:Secreted protein n=1 Tax=Prunus yedoensis var. nudiflora TaxID=2094558 RepID=A0A314Z8M8_PRUYE|nr:hypothetical protein Pyn_40249 [Prunus yedoensis var. nudiflora]PQQ02903.1 hypothetical protein Pyn_11793 [Prunus yedoensis var. nudiflora]PQQ16445.1 hypothetical protein Pyn_01586 [Prunus yedoensis var. nudiflora]